MRRLLLILVALVVSLSAIAAGAVYWLFSGDGLRLAIEQQATAWLGQPVSVGRARAGIFPRTAIHLSNVRIGDPARVTLADVDVSTDFRELLSRRIQDATVTIANSRIEMPLPFSIPSGGDEETPGRTSTDTSKGAVEIVSIRTIALDNVVVVSRGKEVRVSEESSLTGNRLTVRRFEARSGTTTLDAEGEVDLAPRVEARLKATANKLDVDELLALADAFTPPPQPVSAGPAGGRGSTLLVAALGDVRLDCSSAPHERGVEIQIGHKDGIPMRPLRCWRQEAVERQR